MQVLNGLKIKKQWYWHSDKFVKKSKRVLSMDNIRGFYDSTAIKPEQKILLA